MRAPLSIVIPTLNPGAGLGPCLAGLIEGLEVGLIREVVISDGGSQDATEQMAQEAGAFWITGPASRGGQLRRGAQAAGGAWLMFVHADTHLPPGWTQGVADHMARGGPAAFHLGFRAKGRAPRLVAGWANLRSRVFGLPYGDQALLVSRADYDRAGGYPDLPLMEDVALVRALPRITLLPMRVLTGAEKYQRGGWVRRGARNLWTLTRYFLGADPAALARSYRKP